MKSIDDIAEDLAFIVRAGEQWIVSDFSKVHRMFQLTDPNGNKVTYPFDHVADPAMNFQLYAVAPIEVRPPVRPMTQLHFNF
mgnify:CR=1 FL=1